MFCKQCGREIDDDSVFCRKCGSRVTGRGADAKPEENGEPDGEPVPENEFSKEGTPADETGEQDVWVGRRSAKRYFIHFLILGLLLAGSIVLIFVIPEKMGGGVPVVGKTAEGLSGYVRYIPLVLVLCVCAVIGTKTFMFTHKIKYRLTTDRFFVITGIISRAVDELELIRVNDVLMKQGVWERIIGVGTVTIISNDETTPEVRMQWISDPEHVKEEIRNAASKKRGKGLYMEHI